jgi:hypothetical protein
MLIFDAGYRLDGPGLIPGMASFQTGSEAHPASYPVGTGAISPGVKRQGRESDHSLPANAEVKNCGNIPQLSHKAS